MPDHPTAVKVSAPFAYEFGPFRLNVEEQLLSREGEIIPLTPKVFDVLVVLIRGHGHVVSKDQLMQSVWPDSFVEESNLTQNISVLRHILGERSNHEKYIETLPKRGYRFVAPVREVRNENPIAVVAQKVESDLPHELRRPGPAWIWLAALTVLTASACVAVWFWAPHTGYSPGITPRVLPFTSSPGFENDPAFSPDASQIAFSWDGGGGNRDIYVKLIGAETPLRLTTHPGSDRWPVWSPDGSQIAFARRDAGGSGIFSVPALGGTERKLLSVNWESAPFAKLDWSPDGKQIAFSEKSSPQEAASIYLLSLDDFFRRRLTSPSEQYVGNPSVVALGDLSPAFSPDGKSLAFIRRSASVSEDIYLVSVRGGEPKRLTFDNRAVNGLAWTPESRTLVFSSQRGGQLSLWRVSASGGSPERLSFGENASQLAIARRQDRLAYSRISRQRLGIWMIEAASTDRYGPPARFISSTLTEYNARFSPDGKRVAFESERSGSHEIWRCDSDGSNMVRLTNFGGPLTGTPRWSPNGRQIAFDSRPEGNGDIYVINAEGGLARRLTTEASEEMNPGWSRDGQWIYFASNRGGNQQIWKMPANGGKTVQVTTNGGFYALEAMDGRGIYFVKSDRAGIWHVPVEGGAETLVIGLEPHAGPWTGWAFAPPAGCWSMSEQGIYFANPFAHPESGIEFFDFGSKRIAWVAPSQATASGLSVSPDGRKILYSLLEEKSSSDIMLVEDFR